MDREQHEDLQRRIERLERGYNRWRRTALVVGGVAIALFAYSAYSYAQHPGGGQAPASGGQPPAPQTKAEPREAPIDVTGMRTNYVNFFRTTGNVDEVILDLGIQSQVTTSAGEEPIKFNERVVMNFYTAKKLQTVLQTVVIRHEEAFGEIQMDPNKRVRPRTGLE
jgi:hypothetical protein